MTNGSGLRAALAIILVGQFISVAMGAPNTVPTLPPHWNDVMDTANRAAFAGDYPRAIRAWSSLRPSVAHIRCTRDYLDADLRAARETESKIRSGALLRANSYQTFQRRQVRYWAPNPCNRF